MIANTPSPPYYAVIYTSIKTEMDHGYAETAKRMMELAAKQEGFLGIESSKSDLGITVSYWQDLTSIKKWKENTEHVFAQTKGKTDWYKAYKTRICKVERDYEFHRE